MMSIDIDIYININLILAFCFCKSVSDFPLYYYVYLVNTFNSDQNVNFLSCNRYKVRKTCRNMCINIFRIFSKNFDN